MTMAEQKPEMKNLPKIMDKRINPEHRQVVAKLVATLRCDSRIPDEIYQVLTAYYGGREYKISDQVKKAMNSDNLITKQDIKYNKRCARP